MGAREYRALVAGLLLLAVTLACNAPTREAPIWNPTVVQQGADGSPTPTEAAPPSGPTDTPVPDVPGPDDCTLNGAYVADVTVPDDTVFAPGAAFTKVWRLRNSGTCPWEAGTKLVFVSGDALGGPPEVAVGPTAPGATADISVNLAAPTAPGTYRGNWQLQAPDSTRYGSVIFVQIVVPAPATDTPEPTDTPESTDTPEPTETPPADVPPPLADVWNALGGEGGSLGAHTAEAVMNRWVADQRFEHGYMYWRNNEGSPANYIYVLYYQGGTNPKKGAWQRYEDTWVEGMDELSCLEAGPPNGPRRGFGKVWCDNSDVRSDLGDATEEEEGRHAGFQDFENGTLLWTVRLHYVYAVFDDGTWQRFDETP